MNEVEIPGTTSGSRYGDGRGVPQDYTEALRLYRLAADQGLASAQNNLGFMYANGEGVLQDYVEAHMWFNLAAAQRSVATGTRLYETTLQSA